MASFTATAPLWKYDVFLSFRGKDTRNNFTSHLYDALCRKQVKTFIDDELERGEEITPALLRTIEESRISVVIFSKNYASSPWCVDELVKILECKNKYGQIVLPVFYHVDPSDVDEQTGSFGNAFAELEKKFKGKMDKVPKWRADLTNAANISGWDSQVTRPESKLVFEIVQTILKRLKYASSSYSMGLVGIESRIEQIKTLLCIDASDVHTIGIWGMGGIGKTTIAGAFFNCVSSQYDACYFLPNVKDESEKSSGLGHLREELLSKLLESENLRVGARCIWPSFITDRLCRKKVLLVLDDVSDVDQFEFLIGGRDFFGVGSLIVVTSRDKQVLKNIVDEIYEVEELNFHEALQLFRYNAFKGKQPSKDHMELSIQAINYAKGNPLALKVLSSFLFGRRKPDWESAFHKLERIPQPKIFDILRIGFDALDDEVKSIFLDIACFFRGQQVDFAKRILDGCGFWTDIGFCILLDKCLLTITADKLEMHDLLQQMAHEIVRQESIKELGKRSRLWNPTDVYQVLTKNLGTENIEGIFLDVSKIREVELSSRAFARMYNLRLLKIYNSGVGDGDGCKLHLPHGLESLSDELRYLHWDAYPLRSFPSNFCPENLVELNVSSSKVEQLWEGDQNLINLKDVNLSSCNRLSSIANLAKAINLERLNLQFCTSLIKIPSSIQQLDKLIDLDLRHCTSLVCLPNSICSKYLKTFNLSGCSKLKKCPEITGKVKYLNLNNTAIKELPQSNGYLNSLVTLNLRDCKHLLNLPHHISLLTSLQIADLSGCSNISSFPDISQAIRYLYLSGTAIEELPSSIGRLRELVCLDLTDCKGLKDLPGAISKLGCLEKLNLSGCSSVTEFPKVSRNIKELFLNGTAIKEIPSSIECFSELVELHLQDCRRFEILPDSICKLKSLRRFNLSGCCQLMSYPEILEPMENLRYLYLDHTSIKKLPSPIENLMGLSCLQLGQCYNLSGSEGFFNLQFLERGMDLKYLRLLNLADCCILEVPDSLGYLASLEVLDLSLNKFRTIPTSINKLFELQHLGLKYCYNLESLPELPPRLTKLDASRCTALVSISGSSTTVEGNIAEFIFMGCCRLNKTECDKIFAYVLMKFQLYTKNLYDQLSDVLEGASSLCLPGTVTPKWFDHQTRGSTVRIQLPSNWANGQFLGFALCAVVIGFLVGFPYGLQVKCTYHFSNKSGDSQDLYCYFGGFYDPVCMMSGHMFLGFVPCLVATKDDWFSQYNEVSVDFNLEDIGCKGLSYNNPSVFECGVRLLYSGDELKHCDYYGVTDANGTLESRYKDKRPHEFEQLEIKQKRQKGC